MMRKEVKVQLTDYISANIYPEIEQMEECAGHRVLFNPPYHFCLQPIEFPWALAKTTVGVQCKHGTTLQNVCKHLDKEFFGPQHDVRECASGENHSRYSFELLTLVEQIREDDETERNHQPLKCINPTSVMKSTPIERGT